MKTFQQRQIRQSEALMNHAMNRPFVDWASALIIPAAICAGLFLAHIPASATEESPSDTVAGILKAAQAATSAEVFIVPDALQSILPITQEQVPRYGCRYHVDQGGMLDLLAVIRQADIKYGEPFALKPNLRFLIRLNLDGGEQTTVTFMKWRWPNEERLYGSVNGMSASASGKFPENLERWASRFTPTPPNKITICP